MTKAKTSAPSMYKTFRAPTSISVGRKIAYALAVIGIDVVQRSTIRALLPAGDHKLSGVEHVVRAQRLGKQPKKPNVITQAFQGHLKDYERRGWITRGHVLIAMHDRGALLDYALRREEMVPQQLLDIENAVAVLREAAAQSTAEREAGAPVSVDLLVEQRRRELKALMWLMQAPVTGVNRSGTKSVRFVNRSRTI